MNNSVFSMVGYNLFFLLFLHRSEVLLNERPSSVSLTLGAHAQRGLR